MRVSLDPKYQCVLQIPGTLDENAMCDFHRLVEAAGEVDIRGLAQRIRAAAWLGQVSFGNELCGVAAIKHLSHKRIKDLSEESGAEIPEKGLYELGWFHTLKHHRSQKIAQYLGIQLCEKVSEGAIVATCRADNIAIQKVLRKLAFKPTGSRWKSKRGNWELELHIREAHVQEAA